MNFRFGDVEVCQQRKEKDMLVPVGLFWEKFLQKCRKNYVPGVGVIVDEQLHPLKNHDVFRMGILQTSSK